MCRCPGYRIEVQEIERGFPCPDGMGRGPTQPADSRVGYASTRSQKVGTIRFAPGRRRPGARYTILRLASEEIEQGRKVFTLQTLPACDEPFDVGVGEVAGFHSVHPCTSPLRGSLWLCRSAVLQICHRPAGSSGTQPRVSLIRSHRLLVTGCLCRTGAKRRSRRRRLRAQR